MNFKFVNTLSEKVIIIINDRVNFTSKIYRTLNVTISGVFRVVDDLEKQGLIKKYKQGRKICLSLTKKGKQAKELLLELKQLNTDDKQ